jgi:TonB family protein
VRKHALLYFFAAAAVAQNTPINHPGATPPGLISKTEPRYSEEAHQIFYEGSVTLSVVIGVDGKAQDIKVTRPLGLGLDEKAVEAVSGWMFRPAMKDGQPAATFSTVEVNFRFPGHKGWSTARAAFDLPPGASRPVLMKSKLDKTPGPTAATISFDVDEHGDPVNLHVDKATDDHRERAALDVVRSFRFQPAVRDGVPIAAHAVFDLRYTQ